MDYFTRAWALGELSDQECDEVDSRYREFIGSLDQQGPVARFAAGISLHDAFLEGLSDSEGALSLRLLTGDLQRGYWHTLVRYSAGRVVFGRDDLERALSVRPTEIWYDEFSVAPLRMVHRFLLVKPNTTEDRGEVHIEFDALDFSQTPAEGRIIDDT